MAKTLNKESLSRVLAIEMGHAKQFVDRLKQWFRHTDNTDNQ